MCQRCLMNGACGTVRVFNCTCRCAYCCRWSHNYDEQHLRSVLSCVFPLRPRSSKVQRCTTIYHGTALLAALLHLACKPAAKGVTVALHLILTRAAKRLTCSDLVLAGGFTHCVRNLPVIVKAAGNSKQRANKAAGGAAKGRRGYARTQVEGTATSPGQAFAVGHCGVLISSVAPCRQCYRSHRDNLIILRINQ